jgi:hypothetical protein
LWYTISIMKKSKVTQKLQSKYDEMNTAELLDVIRKQETEILELKQELNNIISMVRLGNSRKYGKNGDSVPYPEGVE